MKKNIFIAILMILVLAMGSFIVYDKVLKNNDIEDNSSSEKKEVLKDSDITEEFVDINKDKTMLESWEKDYSIVLNNKNYDLKIKNIYNMTSYSGAGAGEFTMYLDDKEIFNEEFFCSANGCDNSYYDIAIYNGEYLVLKGQEQSRFEGTTFAEVYDYKFIDEKGFSKQLNSYGFTDCKNVNNTEEIEVCSAKKYDLYLDGEYIHYYANEDGIINKQISDYCTAEICEDEYYEKLMNETELKVNVYEYKRKLMTKSEPVKEIFEIGLYFMY